MRRLLVYSQDGLGLGHLRRTSSIAEEILRRRPDCSVLIIADSPAPPPFDLLTGVDYLKLPTVVKTGSTAWRSGMLRLEVGETIGLRAKLILETYRAFEPDVILVDHMPVGALGELKPMLDALPLGPQRPRTYLSLRDILDEASVIRDVWQGLDAYSYLSRYDAVLVLGCREIYDADAAYRLSEFAQEVAFCNYALRRLPATPEPDPGAQPYLLAMDGAGADGFAVAAAFLGALPVVRERFDCDAVVLTGPTMPRADRDRLRADADERVRIDDTIRDSTDLLLGAEAVVTMGGYNSMCEAVGARKPALVVPRRGPSAEQRTRSRLFADRNLVAMLDPDELPRPDALAHSLVELIEKGGIPAESAIPSMDGIDRACDLLLAPRGHRGRHSPSARQAELEAVGS